MFQLIFGFSTKPVVHPDFPTEIRPLVGNPKLTEAVDSLKTVLQNPATRQKYYEWSSAHRKAVCNNELLSQADRQVVKVTVLEWINNDFFAEFSGSVYVNFRKFLNFFATLYVSQQTKIQDAVDKFESGEITALQCAQELSTLEAPLTTQEGLKRAKPALLELPLVLLKDLINTVKVPKLWATALLEEKKNHSFYGILEVAPKGETAAHPLKAKVYIANNNPRTVTILRDEPPPPAWQGRDLRFYTSFRKVLPETVTDEDLLNSFTVELGTDNEELNQLLMPLRYRLPSCLFEGARDGQSVRIQLGARFIELELDQSTAPGKFAQGTFHDVFGEITTLLEVDETTFGFSPVNYFRKLQKNFSHVTINDKETPITQEQLAGLASKAATMKPHKDTTIQHLEGYDQIFFWAPGLRESDVTYIIDSKTNILFLHIYDSHTANFIKTMKEQMKKENSKITSSSRNLSDPLDSYIHIRLPCAPSNIAKIEVQQNSNGWAYLTITPKKNPGELQDSE